MAYTAWSVVALETPSASKWNQLGTNDAGFNDGSLLPTFGRGMIENGYIDVTVSANDLIVTLKYKDGSTPSATKPVNVNIGGTKRTVTAALSVTLADGTDWCQLGSNGHQTNENDLFCYMGYNATDGVTIGVARVPYGRKYGDFNTTSTNFHYCKISTIANAASADAYEVVARFAATLSAGAGFTWTVPTFTNENLIQAPIRWTRRIVYTPTNTSGSGTITTQTVTGAFRLFEKTCYATIVIVLTTNGTGATDFRTTLPTSAESVRYSGTGTDANGTVILTVSIAILGDVTRIDTRTAAGAYPGASGRTYDIQMHYFYI